MPMDMAVVDLPSEMMEKTEALNHKVLLFKPKELTKNGEKLPLFISLHGGGGGGTGDDIKKFQRNPVVKYVSNMKIAAMVFVPQATKKAKDGGLGTWRGRDLDMMLDYIVENNHKIDLSRIYLTGASMGGFGNWVWTYTSPVVLQQWHLFVEASDKEGRRM